jgi:hypothetical protein
VVSFLALVLYCKRKDLQVPSEQEVGWVPDLVGTFWRRGMSLAHARIQIPDCPVRILVTMLTELSCLHLVEEMAYSHIFLVRWNLRDVPIYCW